MAKYTVPIGFSGEPPVGPAMPEKPTPASASSRPRTPSAIASTVSELTPPYAPQRLLRHAEQCHLGAALIRRRDPADEAS